MTKKVLIFSLIFMGILALSANSVLAAASGSNHVNVTSCESVKEGIKISRNNGSKYVLSDGCRDAGSGVRNYTMTCNSATQYKVSWTTNCSQNKEKISPVVTLSVAKEGATVRITALATDNVKVTKTEIYHSSGMAIKSCPNASTCSVVVQPVMVVNNAYFARAYDRAGNESISATIDLTRIDTIKPTVSLVSDKTDYLTNEKVHLRAAASDDTGVVKMQYVDESGKVLKTCPNTNACNYDVGPYPKNFRGTRTYTARAYDAYGNVGYAPRSVNVTPYADITVPVVEIAYERYQNGQVKITARARDQGGSSVIKTEIYKDNGLTKACAGAGECSLIVDPIGNAVSYSYFAKAYDNAKNVGQSRVLIITVYPLGDITPPSVSLSGMLSGSNYTLTATAVDNKTRISGIDVFVSDSSTPLYGWWDNNNTELSVTKVFSGALAGRTMKLVAKAYDDNGNVGVSAPVYLMGAGIVDVPPGVSADAHGENQYGVNNLFLSGYASDDYGLTKVELFWGPTVRDAVLVKRCDYPGTTLNESCVVVFPMAWSRGGFYYAVAYDNKDQVSTTTMKSYSF